MCSIHLQAPGLSNGDEHAINTLHLIGWFEVAAARRLACVPQVRCDEMSPRSSRRQFHQMHSNSIDSPERSRRQQLQQLQQQQPGGVHVRRPRIIPSLSITLPDGNMQPLDPSPLCPNSSPPHSYGSLCPYFIHKLT